MGFEPGGMADKLGNRHEGRWVAKQLIRLLNEEIQSVTVELIGPDEEGVDLLVVSKDGIRQLQQCKARFGSHNSWSVNALASRGVLSHLETHLSRDPQQEFVLVSGIPTQTFADICDSARNSNDNPQDFFQYQIQEVGKERQKNFRDFCNALKLNPDQEEDLKKAFGYLKRTFIELFPDDRSAWSDLLTWVGFLLTGEPETTISVLLTYAENNYQYHKPIYADELRTHLADPHNIYSKKLEYDNRLAPTIEELQRQFSESIRSGLISGKIIPREETSRIIEYIVSERNVVLHGAAGYGKSGILYELTEYLHRENIPYLAVRLDRRIPDKTALRFGKDMGLPDSPAYSLAGLAAGRKCILILDQLDAIRWTAAHSSTAIDVCKELVRQVRSLRGGDRKIIAVFACRTFDLENDQEIKSLLSDTENHGFVEITVKELSEKQLEQTLEKNIASLTDSQKRILAIPQNLAIWMELKKDGTIPDFRSATELMRRFWENRRQVLDKKAGIKPVESDGFLKPLLDYMEKYGEISAPASIASKKPLIRDALTSYGILQCNPGRISFCHQRYLDHLIAERLLDRIYSGEGSVISWLGPRKNQSLYRRDQLRQVLAMLAEESPLDFLSNAQELLESAEVRFHLKHLVIELIGQLDEIPREIAGYCLKLMVDSYWREHILETVLLGHHPWVSHLLKTGILQSWLTSKEEQELNQALRLLRSVVEYIPDQVTKILEPFVGKEGDWPGRVLNTICWKETDDSIRMFELRLQLARRGHVKKFVTWKSLCTRYPLRAIRLIESVVSTWRNDEKETDIGKVARLERWYKEDTEALDSAVKQHPSKTWDLLMSHIERLTSISTDHYDPRLEKWLDGNFHRHETHIARGVVKLVMLAGQTLGAEQPNELIMRIRSLENNISPVVQEIIISAYVHLPFTHSDVGITWLLGDPARFRMGSGYKEPEWMPAVRLIAALSPHCSKELFRQLEDAVIHYHASKEKQDAEYWLKGWRNGHFGHYWGKTQYFLLPAFDIKRIQGTTADLIRVLKRKFKQYPKEAFIRDGTISGGSVGSKLDRNLEKISDRAWLRIISSGNVTENDNHKWIQTNPNRVLTTSVRLFSRSLAEIAKRFPERFGQLALRFPNDVHPSYVSAILEGFIKKQPDPKTPEDERHSWQPARAETIEAVLEKYQAGDDHETAMSFCRLISERADENWSKDTIARLVHYDQNHPDPEIGKLNVHCDKCSDNATVEILFQNTLNCVRGVAANAIGQLLWERKDRFEFVTPGIKSLIKDPHPVVRMAAIEAIYPVLNIDKDLAVHWFCEICKDDLRVAAYPRASRFINYALPSHIKQMGPIILRMAASPLDDVALEGATQVTTRWLFHGFFEKELFECCEGNFSQRKGVAKVAAFLLHDRKYSMQCRKLLRHFINDPDKEVRDELHGIFRKDELLNKQEHETFLQEYIRSTAFADSPDSFILGLEEFPGRLVSMAEAIFVVCEVFSTTLKEKTRDINSQYPYTALEMSSILLRLYEQALGEGNRQIADHCLDIWDLLFENRIGRVIELTSSIDS
ncbi:MAG: hypothetical protein ABFS45_07930 [Pseudomonadota bacterium]